MIRYAHRLPPGAPLQLVGDSIVRKTEHYASKHKLDYMWCLFNHFIIHPDPMVVPVVSYAILEKSSKYYDYDYGYSYDMIRLGLLSEQEKDIINEVGDLVDRHGSKAFDHINDKLECRTIMEQAQKDYPNLLIFLKELVKIGRYHDLHAGNIMLDLDENYRIIDLEGFYTGSDIPDWILKE